MAVYDAIVVGCGAVGSAALQQLAQRGLRVLGLDRFSPPHDRGSSHGRTRMIRQAYFEHPDYVPLVLRAYELWHDLERRAGRTLYRETGLLQIGPPQGSVVPGVLASAKQHGLAVDELSAAEVTHRFPGFRTTDDVVGVFERRAGYLHVEDCIRAQLEQAVRHGAEVRTNFAATAWRSDGSGVVVVGPDGPLHAKHLIVTAGAWASQLLARLDLRLVVRRKPQYWFRPRTPEAYHVDRGTPAFLYETPDGVFYGFPVAGDVGLKCAEHSGGAIVDDPTTLARDVDRADLARVERYLTQCMPAATTVLNDHAPCMYTMSPDEHFIVDRYPDRPQVSFVAGLSGHGFKFAPVLGEVLADWATTGRTTLPIEFLGLARFGK